MEQGPEAPVPIRSSGASQSSRSHYNTGLGSKKDPKSKGAIWSMNKEAGSRARAIKIIFTTSKIAGIGVLS